MAGGALIPRRAPFLTAAGLLLAGVVWLPLHALAADPYFTTGDVSHWEYATRDGRATTIVVTAVVAVVARGVVLAAAIGGPTSIWRRGAMAATLGGTFALLFAWILLGFGH